MALKNQTLSNRKENLENRQAELIVAKQMVESPTFQKFFAEKIFNKNKKLKNGFKCKSWDEYNYTKGLHDGYQAFFDCVEEIETDSKFINNDLKKLDS